MIRHSYAFSGVRMVSEIEVPEWAAFESRVPFERPDVVIVRDGTRQPAAVERFQAFGPQEYRFFIPDAAEYVVRNGSEVVVTPVPGAGDREIRLFLLGSALAALFCQRGLLCLHASVVATPAGALAFCGPAGAGKSTLAARLCERGYTFVADDLCRFDHGADGQALTYPSTPRLKLWRDAVLERRLDPSGLERDHYRADKFHLMTTHADPLSPRPLRAMYLLGWGDTEIQPVPGLAGLRELISVATYRLDLVDRLHQSAGHWRACAQLASRVPRYRFTRPRDPTLFEETLALVEGHAARHLGEPAHRAVEGQFS